MRSFAILVLSMICSSCLADDPDDHGTGGGGGTPADWLPASCVGFADLAIAPCGGDLVGAWRGVTCGASNGPVELRVWDTSTCGEVVSSFTYELESTSSLVLRADGTGTLQEFLETKRTRSIVPRQCLIPGREEADCVDWGIDPDNIHGEYVVSGTDVCHLEDDCICEAETLFAYPDQEFVWHVEEGNFLIVSTWRWPTPFCVRPEGALLDFSSEELSAYHWLVREP